MDAMPWGSCLATPHATNLRGHPLKTWDLPRLSEMMSLDVSGMRCLLTYCIGSQLCTGWLHFWGCLRCQFSGKSSLSLQPYHSHACKSAPSLFSKKEIHRSHMAAPASACSKWACWPDGHPPQLADYRLQVNYGLQEHAIVQLLQSQQLQHFPVMRKSLKPCAQANRMVQTRLQT